MPRRWLLPFCLAVSAAHAAESPPASVTPHDRAYSLGASLGERLRADVPGLDLDALLDGVRQAYKDEPLALPQARIAQILAQEEPADAPPAASQVESALEAERSYLATERTHTGVRELAQGVLVTELSPGTRAQSPSSQRVQVTYTGKRPDGSVFDENSQPQWFRLSSVIEGWRIALLQMPVGATWRVVIPSNLAYGADGAGDLIAPWTPLTFEIHLLDAAN